MQWTEHGGRGLRPRPLVLSITLNKFFSDSLYIFSQWGVIQVGQGTVESTAQSNNDFEGTAEEASVSLCFRMHSRENTVGTVFWKAQPIKIRISSFQFSAGPLFRLLVSQLQAQPNV